MKKVIILILILFPLLSIAQSKLSVSASGGILLIKEDQGENTDLTVSYKVSKNTIVNVSGLIANLKNDDLKIDYDFKKIAATAEYFFHENSYLGLSANAGFSYIFFDKKINLDKNDGLGIDLGIKSTFNIDKHFNYGFILNSTYSSISPGGILQGNFFFKYNF